MQNKPGKEQGYGRFRFILLSRDGTDTRLDYPTSIRQACGVHITHRKAITTAHGGYRCGQNDAIAIVDALDAKINLELHVVV